MEAAVEYRQTSVGQRYVYHTYDALADVLAKAHTLEGDVAEPLRFKLYQNVPHYSLCQTLPLTLGDARWSFPVYRRRAGAEPPSTELTLETISRLLYYSYGFSRHDLGSAVAWPFHRLVPSARCLFPTELYVWLPTIAALPAGIYHYDNLHHRLALLRPGDYRAVIGGLLGADLDGCGPVLLMSSLFWKTAFHYRNFAYRLCTQEAGLVIGSTLLVGATLGWHGQVHYQFLDQPINRLLACEPDEESVLAVVPFYAAPAERRLARRVQPGDQQTLAKQVPPLDVRYLKRSQLDQPSCALLTEIDQASRLTTTAEIVRADPAPRPYNPSATRITPPPPADAPIELAAALHARSSGDLDFYPLALDLAYDDFWEIVRYVLAPYTSDLSDGLESPRLQCYLAINHVAGIAAGVYHLCDECSTLHLVVPGSTALQLQALQPSMSCGAANFVCYVVDPSGGLEPALGARSYRIAHMESGIIAQRLGVLAAAYGLVTRCSDSFGVAGCRSLLQLTPPALPLLQIAIGRERPGSGAGLRYRLAIRF